MKTRFLYALLVLLALCLPAIRATAQTTISLSISASELPMFVPGSTVDETPDPTFTAARRALRAKAIAKRKRMLAALKNHFVASVSLANRGTKAIEFTYDSPAIAATHFIFTLTGEDGATYWQTPEEVVNENGDAEIASGTDGDGNSDPIVATLGAAARWKRTVNVPIVINDQPLLPGVYFLGASAGDYSATTRFEILPPIEETLTGTIVGKVTLAGRDASGNEAPGVSTPAADFYVEVSEIRDGTKTIYRKEFYWSGQTNKSGAFKLSPPVGTYNVSVSGEDADGNWLYADTQVVVTEGMESVANIRILPPLGPREALPDTGIKGIVTNADGTPAAGRSVAIYEVLSGDGDRPAFSAYAMTDEHGAFSAGTPDGTFTVSVGWPFYWDCTPPPEVHIMSVSTVASSDSAIYRPWFGGGSASSTVIVQAGQYAETALTLTKNTWPGPIQILPIIEPVHLPDPIMGGWSVNR